jgi:hypothetical protein
MTLQRTCDIGSARRSPLVFDGERALSRRTFIQEGTPDKCSGVRIIVQNSNKWTKPEQVWGVIPRPPASYEGSTAQWIADYSSGAGDGACAKVVVNTHHG